MTAPARSALVPLRPQRSLLQTEFQSAWPLHKTFRQALGYRLLRAFGLDRLYRLAMVLQGYRNPLAAILKVTSHCNLRCRHCPWHDNQTLQLATDEWRAIIDRAWQVGCDSLILEGGEPTTRRDLQQLIEHARTLGMAVHFITNGTRPLDSYRPHSVIISLQGPQKEHDAIVGAPVFERIIENCMAIPDVPKVVLCTVSPANVHVLEEFVALVHGWVDGIWFNFYYPYRTSSEEPLRDELRRDAAETLVALKRRFPKIMNSTKGLRYIADKRGRLYCDPWYTLNVHFDGRYVHHCTVSFYEEPDCANCYQTCYVEPYLALRLNPASIRFFRMLKGLGRAAAS